MRLKREVLHPVTDADAAILLGGYGAHSPGGRPHEEASLDLWSDDYLVRQWRQHERHLRGLAHTWRWRPTWFLDAPLNDGGYRCLTTTPRDAGAGGPYFYAEALAVRATV